jgi:hypothetical protein
VPDRLLAEVEATKEVVVVIHGRYLVAVRRITADEVHAVLAQDVRDVRLVRHLEVDVGMPRRTLVKRLREYAIPRGRVIPDADR